MTLINSNSANTGLLIKGAASQTANLQEWQDSAGTVLVKVRSSGQLNVGGAVAATTLGVLNIDPAWTALKVIGAASQTGNLQEWQDSSGTVLAFVNQAGTARFYMLDNLGLVSIGTSTTGSASLKIDTNITTRSGIIIKGVASQTANLTEWQNNSGTVLAKIDKDGIITVPAINVVGQSISSNTTMIAGYRYFVDTSASRTLTLPSSATIGDEIQIFDSTNTAGTNNITINSNNGKIEGVVESYIIDVNGAAIVMTYTGSTYGWKVRM
jgi:hypothetical protein